MVAGQGLATDGKHGRSRDDLSKPGVIVTTVGGIVIGLALVFAFLNGYNASGSLVATLISTGVVGPRLATSSARSCSALPWPWWSAPASLTRAGSHWPALPRRLSLRLPGTPWPRCWGFLPARRTHCWEG